MIKNFLGRLIKRKTFAPLIQQPGKGAFILARRRFLCACGCGMFYATAAGTGLLAAATRAEATMGGTVIRVGHLPAGCISHLLLAKVRGEFAKAKLNVILTQFNSPGNAMQSLVANHLEMIHSPWTMTAAAYTAGTTDLRIIGGSGQAGIELVARNGSVKSVEEFIDAAGKGLRVGTLRLDTLELVGYGTMSQHGKSYDDYRMTFFPSMIGMGEAIANKALDVCTLAQPYAEYVVAEQGAVYLTDSNSVWGPEAADCVVTTKAYTINKQQEALKTYLKVLQESAQAFTEDYEAVLDDLQPVYGVPRPILSIALKRQFPNPIISQVGVNGLRQGAKYLSELGYLQPNIIDAVLDLKYQPV
jgi:NitT/TauT family transport system substrate-binding protein